MIPVKSSTSPRILARSKCLPVSSKAARAKTLDFSPLIPCLPMDFTSPSEVIISATNIMCLTSTLRPWFSRVFLASLIID